MNKDVYLEVNASQKPAIELLQAMGYTYISPEDCEKQRGSKYHVLLKDILRGQLADVGVQVNVIKTLVPLHAEYIMAPRLEGLADGPCTGKKL